MIRPVTSDDADAIAAIYNHYVLNTSVTFEEEAVPANGMLDRIRETQAKLPWLVCEEAGRVNGFAYASPWKSRCAYRNSVETTVYLDKDVLGRGLGARLYEPLLQTLKERGFHTAIGGIALPNRGSVALHEKFGFQKVAQFREVGWKFETWIDVGYWQLVF
jgi:L-amino acid N-acyltransferase YncA